MKKKGKKLKKAQKKGLYATMNGWRIDGTRNQVSAFALDGKAISLSPVIAGDKTIISLDSFTYGIYIIKINNESIKIARQ